MDADKPVLDACCGGRRFWFDKQDDRAVFFDSRFMSAVCPDGKRVTVFPDVRGDFRDMPFSDGGFRLVVFDPPHLDRAGDRSVMAMQYGRLGEGWRDDIRRGFAECFRVLASGGALVFKWSECQIPVAEVLALTPERPLFGHRSGKASKTHWIAFIKEVRPDAG